MSELLHNLIESLREELKQYGEMLALLEQQQQAVVNRLAPEVLQSVSNINVQGQNIHAARREREQMQRTLARYLQQPDDATLTGIISSIPSDYRPLMEALLQENNQLLLRVQQRARQNHMLLSRSLEVMQQFINTLCPANLPVYNGYGHLQAPEQTSRTLYEAVG